MSNNMRWDRQIWTLRSIQYAMGLPIVGIEVQQYAARPPDMGIEVQFQAVGQQSEGFEVQNIDQESSKISFEVQNSSFEGCFEMKMIFKNILGVPDLIPAQFPHRK